MKINSRSPPSAAFTLIELIVVVIILSVLAVTVVPMFVGTATDARIGTAKSQVAELESALERLYVHLDRYPTADEGLRILVDPPAADAKSWRGPYVKQLRPDPWGSQYQYRRPGIHHPSGFDLWSRGADKEDGGEGANADIGNW